MPGVVCARALCARARVCVCVCARALVVCKAWPTPPMLCGNGNWRPLRAVTTRQLCRGRVGFQHQPRCSPGATKGQLQQSTGRTRAPAFSSCTRACRGACCLAQARAGRIKHCPCGRAPTAVTASVATGTAPRHPSTCCGHASTAERPMLVPGPTTETSPPRESANAQRPTRPPCPMCTC